MSREGEEGVGDCGHGWILLTVKGSMHGVKIAVFYV